MIGVVSATNNATYTDLEDKINQTSQSTINLEKDYKWGEGDNLNGTVINKSITIDGNNHTLYGSSKARAFYIVADNVTIQNINFKNGKALGLYHTTKDVGGGAIYWLGSNGKLINCTFTRNEAKDLAYDPYAEANQEFIDDETGSYEININQRPLGASTNRGGAIVWFGNNGYIESCEFIENTVNYPDSGGAIYWRSNNATIKNSKFRNNSAWNGGAIYYAGDNLIIYDSEFQDNGFISNERPIAGENFTLINSFKKLQEKINQADCELMLTDDYLYTDGDENGILINKSITIDGANHIINGARQSRIFKIITDNVVLKNINFINAINSVGGSILWIGKNATIINCTFKNNLGFTAGGAIAIKGNNTIIINSTFEDNTVKSGNYGALSTLEKNPDDLVYITVMIAYGGAVYINGDNAIISNSIFTNNTSQGIGDFDSGSQGGAVKIIGFDCAIFDSEFSDNSAAFEPHCQSTYNITIKNTTFTIKASIEPENPNIEPEKSLTSDNNTDVVKKDLSKIIANNLIIYFKSDKKFTVKVYDKNGYIAKNVFVKFTLNNENYKVKTNKNGEASLKITLKPGKFTIITSYNSKIIKKSVTIKNRLISNDLTKKVKKTTTFNVKVLNNKGKAFSKQTVKIKFNGKIHILKSNSKGIVSLKLPKNLKVGKYTVKTSYLGIINTNKIIIKK